MAVSQHKPLEKPILIFRSTASSVHAKPMMLPRRAAVETSNSLAMHSPRLVWSAEVSYGPPGKSGRRQSRRRYSWNQPCSRTGFRMRNELSLWANVGELTLLWVWVLMGCTELLRTNNVGSRPIRLGEINHSRALVPQCCYPKGAEPPSPGLWGTSHRVVHGQGCSTTAPLVVWRSFLWKMEVACPADFTLCPSR